jgi:hypothetical protein
MGSKAISTNTGRRGYLSIKYSLFNTYIAALALSSYPNFQSNNRLSTLHGLTTKAGKRKLNTQRWVWLVGPLWSSWSSWFDCLVTTFQHRGVCFTHGTPSTELVSRALTWLTLGQTYYNLNLTQRPLPQTNLNNKGAVPFPPKSFWLISTTPRRFNSYGAPTFSLSGSNVRHRLGWAVLPGPSNNKSLNKFIFLAALVAYRSSKVA